MLTSIQAIWIKANKSKVKAMAERLMAGEERGPNIPDTSPAMQEVEARIRLIDSTCALLPENQEEYPY